MLWGSCVCAQSLQSSLTLYDPMDYSPTGSSVHGILSGKNTEVGCHARVGGFNHVQKSKVHVFKVKINVVSILRTTTIVVVLPLFATFFFCHFLPSSSFLFPRYLRINLNSTDITNLENKRRDQTNVPFYFNLARIPKSLWFLFLFCFADSFSELDHNQPLETELIIHMFFEIYWMNKRERKQLNCLPCS